MVSSVSFVQVVICVMVVAVVITVLLEQVEKHGTIQTVIRLGLAKQVLVDHALQTVQLLSMVDVVQTVMVLVQQVVQVVVIQDVIAIVRYIVRLMML